MNGNTKTSWQMIDEIPSLNSTSMGIRIGRKLSNDSRTDSNTRKMLLKNDYGTIGREKLLLVQNICSPQTLTMRDKLRLHSQLHRHSEPPDSLPQCQSAMVNHSPNESALPSLKRRSSLDIVSRMDGTLSLNTNTADKFASGLQDSVSSKRDYSKVTKTSNQHAKPDAMSGWQMQIAEIALDDLELDVDLMKDFSVQQ